MEVYLLSLVYSDKEDNDCTLHNVRPHRTQVSPLSNVSCIFTTSLRSDVLLYSALQEGGGGGYTWLLASAKH